MDAEPDLARIASTVGDPRRIQMLALLMEGRALTAKELALGAGIEPATATSHLKRLLDDGLLESAAQGRHKYFRFASEQVAHLVESLMRVAPRRKAVSIPKSEEAIRSARFCYDHLAGSLGTGLLALMLRKGWLRSPRRTASSKIAPPRGAVQPPRRQTWGLKCDSTDAKQLELTAKGEKSLAGLGLDVHAARLRRRQFACRCLDWSERQDHLGGSLGAALADHMKAAQWIERQKHSRVVRITALGREQLKRLGLPAA